VNNLSYDKNGNILSLKRISWLGDEQWRAIDRLSYFYKGNRLVGVNDSVRCADIQNPNHPIDLTLEQSRLDHFCDNGYKYDPDPYVESAPEFRYDASGNMIADVNRSIRISYNPGTNLPNEIMHPEGIIQYHYTLSGQKPGKKLLNPGGSFIYHEQYYGDLVIKDGQPTRILHGDGVVNLSGSGAEFTYHLKDHLGNVRLVIIPGENNEPEVLQANDYYPFGMAYTKNFQSGGSAHQPNKYLYNSKEEQEMPGKFLDYGWRMYDPQLGRWHGVDPLAEAARRWTPYQYAYNNPLRYIDPDGRIVTDFGIRKDGTIVQIGPENSDPDRLFAVDNNDNKINENNFITLEDKNLLPSLANTDPAFKEGLYPDPGATVTSRYDREIGKIIRTEHRTMIQGRYGITSNEKDAKSVFEFSATNSNVEWGLKGNKSNKWIVGTLHESAQAPTFSSISGFDRSNIIYSAHSHPGDSKIDFAPSGLDISNAASLRSVNPNAKSWLFMPKNPKQKWLEY